MSSDDVSISTFGPKTMERLVQVAWGGVRSEGQRGFGHSQRLMIAELTGEWEQETNTSGDGAWFCTACLVVWDGVNNKYIADASLKIAKLYDPISGSERPGTTTGDHVSILFDGQYKIVGSPGGEAASEEYLTHAAAVITKSGGSVYAPNGSTQAVSGAILTEYQVIPPDTLVLVGPVRTRYLQNGQWYWATRWQVKAADNLTYHPMFAAPNISRAGPTDNKYTITVLHSTQLPATLGATLRIEILQNQTSSSNLAEWSLVHVYENVASPKSFQLTNVAPTAITTQIRAYSIAPGNPNATPNPQMSLMATYTSANSLYIPETP